MMEQKCIKCGLLELLNENKICIYCDAVKPNNRGKKELRIKNLLDRNNIKYISHDKIMENGICNKYRPDFILDCISHYIIIEVDENQHQSYPCICEQKRMINLHQSCGLDTLFIRYNPDKYKFNGEMYSCHKKNDTHNKREEILLSWIKYYQEKKIPSGLSSIYLFYDECDRNKIKLKKIKY